MLRSAGTVIAGVVAMVFVVMVGTLVATAAFVPGGIRESMSATPPPPTRPYLVANLIVSFLGAAAGGALTARLATSAPWVHVGVLAAIVVAMAIPSIARGSAPGQPPWYPAFIAMIGIAGVTVGAALAWRAAD